MNNYLINSITYRKIICLLPVFFWLLLGSFNIHGQETEDFEVWDSLSDDLGLITDMEYQVKDADEKELVMRLGMIGGVAPGYRGSDEYEFSYAPNIHMVWNDFVFIKGRKLGVKLFDNGHFYGGAFVRYTGGRSDNNDGLEGLGDISRTLTSGAYLRFRYEGIRLKTELRHDILNEGHGTIALFSVSSKIPWERPLFSLAVESTWASSKYMDTFFSINSFQSFRSGLSEYYADSGFRNVSVSLSTGYELTEHWSVNGQVRYQRLIGDAADSPIVSEVGSENNFIAGVGLNYTF